MNKNNDVTSPTYSLLDEEDLNTINRVFSEKQDDSGMKTFHSESEHDFLEISSEEDISDLSDAEDENLVARYRDLKEKPLYDLDDEGRRRLLVSSFSEDQMTKFESFRRMRVNKPGIKKVCTNALGHSVSKNLSMILAGLSKSFLSEVITKAFDVQEKNNKAQLKLDVASKINILKEQINDNSVGAKQYPPKRIMYKGDVQTPLQPEHIREAWRLQQLNSSGALSSEHKGQGEASGKLFR